MGGDGRDLKQRLVRLDAINDAPLIPQPGGPVALPLASQRFVAKPLDEAKAISCPL
jgi:hypothetical protein